MGGVLRSETLLRPRTTLHAVLVQKQYAYLCNALIPADSLCDRQQVMIYMKLKRMQKVRVFRDVTLCCSVSAYRRFEEPL